MSLIRKLRDRLQGATLHDLWVETRWVLHHSKRYRRSIAAYVLLGIASIALSLLSSLSSRELINAIVYLQGGGRRVLFCGVIVVLLAGSTIVLNALVSRFSAKINLRIGNELRAEVFGMFLNTDWESLQQFHSGDLLSRINTDVSNVAGSVLGWIPSLILRLTQFLASLAVILVYDPTMAVLALLSAPVTLLLSRPLVGKMRSFNRDMRAVGSEMTAFQEETLQNIPAIKAFHLVDTFRERLDRVQERYYDTGIAFQRFSILTSSFLSSCGMLVSYLCLGWGAYRLWQGRIDFGTMVLFLQLASYLSSSLSALIHLVPSAIEASVSARRIMSVLELPRSSSCRSPSGADYTGIIDENGRTRTGASEFLRLFSNLPKLSCYSAGYCEIAASLCSSQSSRFLNTTINENAGTARSAGGYQPDVPHQFREFRSSMLSSGRQTASILIRLVLPDLPFVMPPVITTLSPGCRCIVSRAARSA